MSPEFSPALQVVAYTILPSEHVIAHKADLAVTKCFLNKVGWCWSPTGNLPMPEAACSTLTLRSVC